MVERHTAHEWIKTVAWFKTKERISSRQNHKTEGFIHCKHGSDIEGLSDTEHAEAPLFFDMILHKHIYIFRLDTFSA